MIRKTTKKSPTARRKAAPRKPPRTYNVPVKWTKKMLELLGTVPDREIAERYGIDGSTVCKKRKQLRIPSFRHPPPRSARVVKILGLPTWKAAQRLGISENAVASLRKKWNLPLPSRTEWRWDRKTLNRLGREPDTWIAWTTGMGFRTVRAKRESLGIPPCGRLKKWTPEENALLGTLPDGVIAERIGRSAAAVRAHRLYLGIPGCPSTTPPKKPSRK